MGRIVRYIVLALVPVFFSVRVSAQTESQDSLVRLIVADVARQIEIDGKNYRKVVGDAVFFHNNTYLSCDSAYWNVTDNYIDALGHVCIEQDETTLTGDSLKYIINENLAKFRGHLVELKDDAGNVLRTNNLDYNTKDSIGIFNGGASMMDEDGNIIESIYGRYESGKDMFTFISDVQMFSDSLFFICDTLTYHTDRNIANFYGNTRGWYNDNMISAVSGWYNRDSEKLFFRTGVHSLTEEQELWCDTLNYDRNARYAHLLGNVQLVDTTRGTVALAGDAHYWQEPRRTELYRDPAVVLLQDAEKVDENGRLVSFVDSVYMGADAICYHTEKMFEVDSMLKVVSEKRYKEAQVDPLAGKSKSSKKSSGKSSGKSGDKSPDKGKSQSPDKNMSGKGNTDERSIPDGHGNPDMKGHADEIPDANKMGKPDGAKPDGAKPDGRDRPAREAVRGARDSSARAKMRPMAKDSVPATDTVSMSIPGIRTLASGSLSVSDTLSVSGSLSAPDTLAVSDTLHVPDSLMVSGTLSVSDTASVADTVDVAPPLDTTQVSFVTALKNVKVYREGLQLVCDSLEFNSLDSLVRLYISPMIWHEVDTQISADSVQFLIKGQVLKKGFLFSNSLVVSAEEDGKYFHQIKSPDMIGYFTDNELTRFDAIGGVNALLFLTENSLVTNMNRKDCKIMSGTLKDGTIQKITSFENAKSDMHPIMDVTSDQAKLRGFIWTPEKRPASSKDITSYKVRPSEREGSAPDRKFPKFSHTDKYFDGYMKNIFREIDSKGGIIWRKR